MMKTNEVKIIAGNHNLAAERLRYLSIYHGIANISTKYNNKETLKETLDMLPICTKDDLLTYTDMNIDRFLAEAVLFSETSGSTGSPLPTPRNQIDLQWNILNHISAYKNHLSPGIDRIAIIHPSILSPFVEASALALHKLSIGYIRVYPIPGICDYQRIYDVFKRYKITSIMTTPTIAYRILYEIKKIGNGELPSLINHVLLTGEVISKENIYNMNSIVGNNYATKPFVYGSSETAVLMYGIEDSTYKPFINDFVFEIDPIVGLNHIENEITGTLIVSWLRNGLLPIIRYNTEDIFHIIINGGGEDTIFEYIGRSNDNDVMRKREIDKYIYSIPYDIYDYSVIETDKKLHINLICIHSDEIKIIDHILSQTQDKIITLCINSKNNSFYEYIPQTKSNRYERC